MTKRRTIVRIGALSLAGRAFDEAAFRARLAERVGQGGATNRETASDAVREAANASVRGERS